jgi:hypothetical protein
LLPSFLSPLQDKKTRLTESLESFNQALRCDPSYADARLHKVEVETELASLEIEPAKKAAKFQQVVAENLRNEEEKDVGKPSYKTRHSVVGETIIEELKKIEQSSSSVPSGLVSQPRVAGNGPQQKDKS